MAETSPFTLEDAKRVRQSFRAVIADPEGFSADLYQYLFEVAPAARPLFSDNMTLQREKLVAQLATFVTDAKKLASDNTDISDGERRRVIEQIRLLGDRHREYQVVPEHYDVLKDVMMHTLRKRIGDGFDAETEQSWTTLYDFLAALMK